MSDKTIPPKRTYQADLLLVTNGWANPKYNQRVCIITSNDWRVRKIVKEQVESLDFEHQLMFYTSVGSSTMYLYFNDESWMVAARLKFDDLLQRIINWETTVD